jgi:hypothetical protein
MKTQQQYKKQRRIGFLAAACLFAAAACLVFTNVHTSVKTNIVEQALVQPICATSSVYFADYATPGSNDMGPAAIVSSPQDAVDQMHTTRCYDPTELTIHAQAEQIPGFVGLDSAQLRAKSLQVQADPTLWRTTVQEMNNKEAGATASIITMSGPYQTYAEVPQTGTMPLIVKVSITRPSFVVLRMVFKDGLVVNFKLDCHFQPVSQTLPNVSPVPAVLPSAPAPAVLPTLTCYQLGNCYVPPPAQPTTTTTTVKPTTTTTTGKPTTTTTVKPTTTTTTPSTTPPTTPPTTTPPTTPPTTTPTTTPKGPCNKCTTQVQTTQPLQSNPLPPPSDLTTTTGATTEPDNTETNPDPNVGTTSPAANPSGDGSNSGATDNSGSPGGSTSVSSGSGTSSSSGSGATTTVGSNAGTTAPVCNASTQCGTDQTTSPTLPS